MLSHDLTCCLQLILLWLIRHVQCEEYKSRNFSLCRFLQSPDIPIRLSSKYSSKHFDLRHIQCVHNFPIQTPVSIPIYYIKNTGCNRTLASPQCDLMCTLREQNSSRVGKLFRRLHYLFQSL